MSALPKTMRCIEVSKDGSGSLIAGERPVPRPKAGEVLVKIAAAGVNRPDLMQVAGLYPPPPGASDILGLEAAGDVVALGDGVEDISIGDRVTGLLTGGAYAQYATLPAVQCLPVPKGLSLVEAAGLPETFFTVWHNIVEKSGLSRGESLLVHGGSSGIGVAAIQIAKQICGATVITTVGSDAKRRACLTLGADIAVNYRTEDFVDVVNAATKCGADVILDMVCGDYMSRNFKCAAPDGRLNLIAFLKGPKTETNFTPLLLKRLTLMGATLRAQSPANKARMAAGLREKVWPKLENGDIKPVIHAVVPFEDAQKAHDILKQGQHIGKVVLDVS